MSREQKLVDICFELVATVTDHEYSKHFRNMSIDDRMTWVAEQLRGCGFDTEPCGSLWGVLK